MPDLNHGFTGSARQNGAWGRGPNGYQAATLGKVQYISPDAFGTPQNVSTVGKEYLIGNAPRTHAYDLIGPSNWDWDAGLRRTFPIHEKVNFVFEADCIDVSNHVNFDMPSSSNLQWSASSASFSTVTGASGNRDWQFAGHINF